MSTVVEQLSTTVRITETKLKYHQNIWQMFVGFRKAYDSICRHNLYYIIEEFSLSKKLINLIELYME